MNTVKINYSKAVAPLFNNSLIRNLCSQIDRYNDAKMKLLLLHLIHLECDLLLVENKVQNDVYHAILFEVTQRDAECWT